MKIKMMILLYFVVMKVNSQIIFSEQQIIDSVLEKNYQLNSALLKVQSQQNLQGNSWNIPDPEVFVDRTPFEPLTLNVEQTVDFPLQYVRQGSINKQQIILAEKNVAITRNDIIRNTKLIYVQMQFLEEKRIVLYAQDSFYSVISNSSTRAFEAGNIDYLGKLFAETKAGEIHQQYLQTEADLAVTKNNLKLITSINSDFKVAPLQKTAFQVDSVTTSNNPLLNYLNQNISLADAEWQLEKTYALPDLLLGYNIALENDPSYSYGFKLGITVPLWFYQYSARSNSAKTEVAVAEAEYLSKKQTLEQESIILLSNFYKYDKSLQYYEKTAMPNSNKIIETSMRLQESGESDYIEYLRILSDAYSIRLNYIEALYNYNSSVIEINYLNGN